MTEQSRAWKLAHPEKVKEQKARWYQKNKTAILQKDKARCRPITEIKKAQNSEWKKNNRDSCRSHDENRRSRKLASGRLSSGLSAKLFTLQKGKCACCGKPLGGDYHMDHIMPLARGGTNTDDNIQLLRHRCNNQKHAKHPVDFMRERGFLL